MTLDPDKLHSAMRVDANRSKRMNRSRTDHQRRRRLVLVVEDHPDTQSALAAHLEEQGWEVAVASDGDSALRIARDRRPDLVCLDVNLPAMSGYDVCEQIRTDPALETAKVLMLSA